MPAIEQRNEVEKSWAKISINGEIQLGEQEQIGGRKGVNREEVDMEHDVL